MAGARAAALAAGTSKDDTLGPIDLGLTQRARTIIRQNQVTGDVAARVIDQSIQQVGGAQ
ncbi:MAG: hypothetical protein HGA66_04050 [Holophaga sp.]|nr:hypothetical protein [Holophaga sp.]